MSANVGLSTPRGSGTSGYVQKNMSFLRPREKQTGPPRDTEFKHPLRREPNKEILEHERKREVEVKCFELRDKLEEEGKLSEEEIDEEVDALRKKLLAELDRNGGAASSRGRLKEWDTHEIAARKLEENSRFERAVGIRKDGGYDRPRWARDRYDGAPKREEARYDDERREERRRGVESRSLSPDERDERRRSPDGRRERRRDSRDEERRSYGRDRRDRYASRSRSRSVSRSRSRSRGDARDDERRHYDDGGERKPYYDRDSVRNHREWRERKGIEPDDESY